MVLRAVRWGCRWFLFSEYFEEFVIFWGNWFLARPGGLFDLSITVRHTSHGSVSPISLFSSSASVFL